MGGGFFFGLGRGGFFFFGNSGKYGEWICELGDGGVIGVFS